MPRRREELEFERNRQEILKQSKVKPQRSKQVKQVKKSMDHKSDSKYAWEYELEVYKEQKKKERFFRIGAWCGILSLILTLVLNYKQILSIF